jgi:hypothetical protein
MEPDKAAGEDAGAVLVESEVEEAEEAEAKAGLLENENRGEGAGEAPLEEEDHEDDNGVEGVEEEGECDSLCAVGRGMGREGESCNERVGGMIEEGEAKAEEEAVNGAEEWAGLGCTICWGVGAKSIIYSCVGAVECEAENERRCEGQRVTINRCCCCNCENKLSK